VLTYQEELCGSRLLTPEERHSRGFEVWCFVNPRISEKWRRSESFVSWRHMAGDPLLHRFITPEFLWRGVSDFSEDRRNQGR
jgi:hypothetical protein